MATRIGASIYDSVCCLLFEPWVSFGFTFRKHLFWSILRFTELSKEQYEEVPHVLWSVCHEHRTLCDTFDIISEPIVIPTKVRACGLFSPSLVLFTFR